MESRARIASIFPSERWRSLLRSLLRECSYLPDPIARSACHDHVLRRFRRYHKQGDRILDDSERLIKIGRDARWYLSVLQRANAGYLKTLESVMRFAYGRSGRRRVEMLNNLLQLDVPKDSASVQELIASPAQFEDGWKAPKVIETLLKSQTINPIVSQLSNRPYLRNMAPPVSKKNSWDRKMPKSRRRNIRRKWYRNVLHALYPPLPDAELQMLTGLLSKEIPWKPPKRRSKQQTVSADAISEPLNGMMLRKVLSDGPPKGQTFADFKHGRPHHITRRIMIRLWQRISRLVPRYSWDTAAQKHCFKWDTAKLPHQIALSVDKEKSRDLFTSLETTDTPEKQKVVTASS